MALRRRKRGGFVTSGFLEIGKFQRLVRRKVSLVHISLEGFHGGTLPVCGEASKLK